MNEVTVAGLTHVLEGILIVIVGITTEVLAPIFHMATPNPGIGGFQMFLIIYGMLKIFGGIHLMRAWSR